MKDKSNLSIRYCRLSNDFVLSLPHFVFAQSMYSVESIPLTSTCFRGGAIDYRMSFCVSLHVPWVCGVLLLLCFSFLKHATPFFVPTASMCRTAIELKPISFGDYCFLPMPPYDFSFTCVSFWFHSMTVQVALLKYLLHLNKQKFLQAC